MRRTGLQFIVEGEYKRTLAGDESDEEGWEPFETSDLHPSGQDSFTVWSSMGELDDETRTKLTNQAVAVVDWMRGEKGWDGFCADLILAQNPYGKTVYTWELC